MLDVLLVIPPYYYKTKVLTSSVKEYAGMGYLAAVLRENGYRVEILDADLAGYGIEETVDAVLSRKAMVVGFTLLQVAATACIDVIKQLRSSGMRSHITIGGHFPSFTVGEVFKECEGIDSIVIGEGEYTLLELVGALKQDEDWKQIDGIVCVNDGKILINNPRPLIEDLDTLPFQSRDTLAEVIRRGGPAAIITSRGCYGNCAFCSVNAFYKKSPGPSWRGRSPEDVGDELEWVVKKWGADIFVFNDDNFFGPGKRGKERAYQIGEEILKRGLKIYFAIPAAVNDVDMDLFRFLKKAGLRSVFLGIESMNQSDLKFLNKHTTVAQNEEAIRRLEELGIFYQIGFILFYPHSTLKQVKYNITYIRDYILKNDYCGTQVFTGDLRIFHGTPLEKLLEGENYVHQDLFHYTYESQDRRVEKLRELMDQLILKKTFPLMVDCKEEFMRSSKERWLRTLICDIQLSMALKAIGYLEKDGTISSEQIKEIIRSLNGEIKHVKEKQMLINQNIENDGTVYKKAYA